MRKAANAKAKVLVGYSQNFVDQSKCKELSLNQIAQGSQVVFQVAGQCGLGALSAAKDKGVWGIGVDADQAYLGAHMLTSAVKRVDVGRLSHDEAGQVRHVQGRRQHDLLGSRTVASASARSAPRSPAVDRRGRRRCSRSRSRTGKVKAPTTVK